MRMPRILFLIAVSLATAALAGCETTDDPLSFLAQTPPQAQQAMARAPALKLEPPMTHTRPAQIC
jgi:hypothetical protein